MAPEEGDLQMQCRWKFIAAPRAAPQISSWSWVKCMNGRGIQVSPGSFTTFLGCVADARLRGFGVADPFDIMRERRKENRELAA